MSIFLREFKQSLRWSLKKEIQISGWQFTFIMRTTFFLSFSSEGPDNEASSAPLKVPMDNENDQENI